MNKNLLIGGIISAMIIVIVLFLTNQKPQGNSSITPKTQTANSKDGKMVAGFSGKVLAGSKSPYIIFNKTDYEKALASNKIVFLDFYANWCPICRAEAPEIKAGFDSLNTDQVIGFRVNYNDSETDEDEKALADKFQIPYQHTKVILKSNSVILKSSDTWDKNTFASELEKILK